MGQTNLIDAFRQSDQRTYLDWLAGKPSGANAVAEAAFVLVNDGSAGGAEPPQPTPGSPSCWPGAARRSTR